MLNNDFHILVQKYERYQKSQQKSRNRKILFLGILLLIIYFLLTQDSSQPAQQENNITNKVNTVQTVEQNETNNSPKEPIIPSDIKEKVTPKKSQKTTEHVKKQPKINQLRLQVTTKKESLYQLLENQAKLKNYSSTVAVANYHYSKKEYQKAIKWAIEASKKNKSKARPWIIYAKSKKALGHDAIAKKALTLYLKKHPSQEAQEVLNSL